MNEVSSYHHRLFATLVGVLVQWIRVVVLDKARNEDKNIIKHLPKVDQKAVLKILYTNPTPDLQGRTPKAQSQEYAPLTLGFLLSLT